MRSSEEPIGELGYLEELIEGGSPFIFLTGKAGTGKTTLLKKIYEKYRSTAVKIAPTGVAALEHRWPDYTQVF